MTYSQNETTSAHNVTSQRFFDRVELKRKRYRALKPFIFALSLLAFTVPSLMWGAAADAQSDTATDCDAAHSLMSEASKMGSSETLTGDQDKDFMLIMMDHEKGTMMMMRVEAACGRNPNEKALAQKPLAEEQQRMELFRNTNSSQ